MVGIIDYGMGNLLSVYHALDFIGVHAEICSNPGDIVEMKRIILPGVGAFGDCIRNLNERGFIEPLNRAVMRHGIPILGICVGMQVMAERSFEAGEHQGLGWIKGDVIRIQMDNPRLRVPHMGWNDTQYRNASPLFKGLPDVCDFYFVHSYHIKCNDPEDIEATCDYGCRITAAVRRNNIFATQFHPEKSQDFGIRVLENFLTWNP